MPFHETAQRVERAAGLERVAHLQRFQLQPDVGARERREPMRLDERRDADL